MSAVSAFQEGLENIPGIMGSPVRKRGKVDSFRSGMAEGVKGLGYGLYDGITGVVTEPYQGFRQNGIGGFISGAIRGCEFFGSSVGVWLTLCSPQPRCAPSWRHSWSYYPPSSWYVSRCTLPNGS